jgi:hypothetical protein
MCVRLESVRKHLIEDSLNVLARYWMGGGYGVFGEARAGFSRNSSPCRRAVIPYICCKSQADVQSSGFRVGSSDTSGSGTRQTVGTLFFSAPPCRYFQFFVFMLFPGSVAEQNQTVCLVHRANLEPFIAALSSETCNLSTEQQFTWKALLVHKLANIMGCAYICVHLYLLKNKTADSHKPKDYLTTGKPIRKVSQGILGNIMQYQIKSYMLGNSSNSMPFPQSNHPAP